MADITVTSSATVIPSANAQILTGTCGTTITAGKTIYSDASDSGKLKLALGGGTVAQAAVAGLALCTGYAGQVIRYVTEDPALVLGALSGSVQVADVIILGASAGTLANLSVGPLASDQFTTVLGPVISTDGSSVTIKLKINASGVPNA